MNKISLALTRALLRLQGSKFVRIDTIELTSQQEEEEVVVVFSSKVGLFLGQVTPFGTTTINELVLDSGKLLEYVIAHESAHRRQWFRHLIYPIGFIFVMPIVPLLAAALAAILSAIIAKESFLLLYAAICLAISIVLLMVFASFSWFLEVHADFGAIKKLGMQLVIDARDEGRKLLQAQGIRKQGLFLRSLACLTHPPFSLTSWLYRFFNSRCSKALNVKPAHDNDDTQ